MEDNEKYGFIGGWMTIGAIKRSNYLCVPDVPGVYLIHRPADKPPVFRAINPVEMYKGRPAAYPIASLEAKWVPSSSILYHGQAGGGGSKSTLRKRIREFFRWGEGHTGHSGGRAIWQLDEDHDTFRVAWPVRLQKDPRESEREILREFVNHYGKLPFANWRT